MRKAVSFLFSIFLFTGLLLNTFAETGFSSPQAPAQTGKSSIGNNGLTTPQSNPGTPSISTDVINQMMGTEGNVQAEKTENLKEEIQTELPTQTGFGETQGVEEQSDIERMYSSIVQEKKRKLKQFGYKFFKKKGMRMFLPVGKDYIVGPGDSLVLYLWGDPVDILGLKGMYNLLIDREGKIYIPNLGVYYVWGLSVEKVQKILKNALSKKFKSFEMELSVGKLRQFPVYVSGFVKNPGSVMVTGIYSILDVLSEAGGVSKNGSLRNIILRRVEEGEKKEIKIDLYDFFAKGNPINIRIKEGDIIYVPPIGKTVGIKGVVKRPAIYEIKDEKYVKDVINLAGGVFPSVYEKGLKIIRYKNNQLHLIEGKLSDEKTLDTELSNGDFIIIRKIVEVVSNSVIVKGYVSYPGEYQLEKNKTLKDLIEKVSLFPDTNIYYGEIIRQEEGKYTQYLNFVPKDILEGKDNINLKPMDIVRFYQFGDIKKVNFNKFKNAVIVKGQIKYPGVFTYKKGMKLSYILNNNELLVDTNIYYGEIVRKEFPDLKYEVINFSPKDILEGKKDIELKPMDEITFYPKWVFKPVQVSGEVQNAQIIPYYEGVKLLDVIKNVKLKEKPRFLKAVIYRKKKEEKKEKETELQSNQQTEQEIPEDLKYLANTKKILTVEDLKNLSPEEYAAALQRKSYVRSDIEGQVSAMNKELIQQEVKPKEEEKEERHAIVYLYDLLIKGDKEVNLDLNPGDKILIQKIEASEKNKKVVILGEVNRPGIYDYTEGMRLADLIERAGGYTTDAYPRGLIFIRESAKKLQEEQLNVSLLTMQETLAKSQEGYAAVGASPEEQALIQITLNKQKQLLDILKQKAKLGLGRVALDVPTSLEKLKKSKDNIELNDGDYIYVPSKPNYVLVLGDVYNQISLPYREDKTVRYYLNQVGGLGKNADEKNIYVIKANGRVISKRQGTSFFGRFKWEDKKFYFRTSFYDMKLEQGDTIVVPSEIKVPVLWRPLLRDVTQIIFQALSTAVLAKRL